MHGDAYIHHTLMQSTVINYNIALRLGIGEGVSFCVQAPRHAARPIDPAGTFSEGGDVIKLHT